MTWLAATAAVYAAWWVLSRWLWPYAPCRACQGSAKNPGSNRGRWGQCRRCGGTGRRMRAGARAVHQALRRHGG